MTNSENEHAVFLEAERSFESGYAKAARLWSSLSDGDSVFNSGNAFREAGDNDAAKRQLRLAIKLGVREAYLNLGFMLEDEGDISAGRALLEEGAEAGDPGAMAELAGRLTKSDPKRARSLAIQLVDDELVGQDARQTLDRLEGERATRDRHSIADRAEVGQESPDEPPRVARAFGVSRCPEPTTAVPDRRVSPCCRRRSTPAC